MKHRYTWRSDSNSLHYTEEGFPASGYGELPKGTHESDWVLIRKKGKWYAQSRFASGAVGPFKTPGEAKRYIDKP